MADSEQVKRLKKGRLSWDKWRSSNPGVWPDLVGANLQSMDLSGFDFYTADLREANLSNCILKGTNLTGSVLIETNLSNSDLTNAELVYANLNGAKLKGAILNSATMGTTILTNNDLRGVHGLEKIRHYGRSHIGIDTIYRSKGEIPENFLRSVGIPDIFIQYMASLTQQPIEFHSCFISYSSKDFKFAEQLHSDLQNKGVRCWFAPEDLKIGNKFRNSIDKSIHSHDKLLLIFSENSVISPWVEDEVEAAFERERKENREILFPIKIDDAVMESQTSWAATIRRNRHIGDFTNWQDYNSYQKTFDRLLRDLKSENNKV